MKHGPIALINSDKGHEQETVVILYILDNGTYETMMNTMDQMLTRNAYVVIITDCLNKINDFCKKHENKKSTMQYHFAIEIPALKHLSYLLGIIPIQLLVENIS